MLRVHLTSGIIGFCILLSSNAFSQPSESEQIERLVAPGSYDGVRSALLLISSNPTASENIQFVLVGLLQYRGRRTSNVQDLAVRDTAKELLQHNISYLAPNTLLKLAQLAPANEWASQLLKSKVEISEEVQFELVQTARGSDVTTNVLDILKYQNISSERVQFKLLDLLQYKGRKTTTAQDVGVKNCAKEILQRSVSYLTQNALLRLVQAVPEDYRASQILNAKADINEEVQFELVRIAERSSVFTTALDVLKRQDITSERVQFVLVDLLRYRGRQTSRDQDIAVRDSAREILQRSVAYLTQDTLLKLVLIAAEDYRAAQILKSKGEIINEELQFELVWTAARSSIFTAVLDLLKRQHITSERVQFILVDLLRYRGRRTTTDQDTAVKASAAEILRNNVTYLTRDTHIKLAKIAPENSYAARVFLAAANPISTTEVDCVIRLNGIGKQ